MVIEPSVYVCALTGSYGKGVQQVVQPMRLRITCPYREQNKACACCLYLWLRVGVWFRSLRHQVPKHLTRRGSAGPVVSDGCECACLSYAAFPAGGFIVNPRLPLCPSLCSGGEVGGIPTLITLNPLAITSIQRSLQSSLSHRFRPSKKQAKNPFQFQIPEMRLCRCCKMRIASSFRGDLILL